MGIMGRWLHFGIRFHPEGRISEPYCYGFANETPVEQNVSLGKLKRISRNLHCKLGNFILLLGLTTFDSLAVSAVWPVNPSTHAFGVFVMLPLIKASD